MKTVARLVLGLIGILGGIIVLLASCATTAPLTLQDLPSKYEPMSTDQLQKINLQASGKLFNTDMRIDQCSGFVRVKPFSMIVCVTAILSDPFEVAAWDKISKDPEVLTAEFAKKNESVSDLETASTGDQLGSGQGMHVSWTEKESASQLDGDMILFRRDKVAFLLVGVRWHGEESPDLEGIARTMDARRESAR